MRAKIDPISITKKPSAYVEVTVDGKLARKTEIVKNTYEPTWSNETFTVLVTTTSKCLLRVFSHSTFRRDVLIGEARLDVNKQLVKEQGKFDNTNLTLDIKVNWHIILDLGLEFCIDKSLKLFSVTGRSQSDEQWHPRGSCQRAQL